MNWITIVHKIDYIGQRVTAAIIVGLAVFAIGYGVVALVDSVAGANETPVVTTPTPTPTPRRVIIQIVEGIPLGVPVILELEDDDVLRVTVLP